MNWNQNLSSAAEHITKAESLLKRIDSATGADIVGGKTSMWIQEASVHALLAIAYKLVTK